MSSLLEQAIVDAKALKNAALKNAENLVIEKYSQEIKETMSNLLEVEEPAAPGAPTGRLPEEDQFIEEFLPQVVCTNATCEVIDKSGNVKGYITNKELQKTLTKS